jgi:two-component system LytT family response regulator
LKDKIKVVLAEDNLDSQEIITNFIQIIPEFEIIGVANNGEELLDLNINKTPDLALVDIKMPKLNGIDAVRSCIIRNPNLRFIFTTAYDEYAVSAFELDAIDYIVKPIKKQRLFLALERAKQDILQFRMEKNKLTTQKRNLVIKIDRSSYFIPLDNVIYIEKDNRKTVIHTIEEIYETNETLESIFQKVNPDFYQTHRSFIVNTKYVSHITLASETYFAHFRNYPNYAHVSKLRINDFLEKLDH